MAANERVVPVAAADRGAVVTGRRQPHLTARKFELHAGRDGAREYLLCRDLAVGIGTRLGSVAGFYVGALAQNLFQCLIEYLMIVFREVRIGRVFHETAAPALDGTFGPTYTDTINDELIYCRETVI